MFVTGLANGGRSFNPTLFAAVFVMEIDNSCAQALADSRFSNEYRQHEKLACLFLLLPGGAFGRVASFADFCCLRLVGNALRECCSSEKRCNEHTNRVKHVSQTVRIRLLDL